MVPVLCALALEHGDEKKRMPIRAAALQALAAMVSYTRLSRSKLYLWINDLYL